VSVFHLLAVALGAAVCLQGAANGLLGQRIGLPLALTINTTIVFAGCLAWLVFSRLGAADPAERASAPLPYYTGGVSGLVILTCAALAFPRLGASATTVLAVASQLVTAVVLDRIGVTEQRLALGPAQLLGLALVAVGVALVLGAGARAER
jgi:transporter family-2 protein